jgi:hypothetical protein
VQGFKEPATPWFTDQILPFDITIAGANEYGAAASAKLFGVEILNEGFGTSIDDTVIEQMDTGCPFVWDGYLFGDCGTSPINQGLRPCVGSSPPSQGTPVQSLPISPGP